MNNKKQHSKERRTGLRPVAAFLPGLTKKALGRFGFSYIGLITDWEVIMGPEISRQSAPEKLTFPRNKRECGVLRLRAESGAALTIQHLQPQILDRINTYFGYRAVVQLKIVNGTVAKSSYKLPPHNKSDKKHSVNRKVITPKLLHVLERFGRSVQERESDRKNRNLANLLNNSNAKL